MEKQSDIIKQLSDQEIKMQLILSQLLLVFLSVILSYLLFDSFLDWFDYFHLSYFDMFYYGVIPGLIIVSADFVCMAVFPKYMYDDGGINDRVFHNRSVPDIFFLTLLVAIAEELLFRGVLQTSFGYFIASGLFVLVHFRYLKKPILFLSIIVVSFYIGYIFVLTENLVVTITTHFVFDFILGLVIRFRKRGATYG